MKDDLVLQPDETVKEVVDRSTFPHATYATVSPDEYRNKFGYKLYLQESGPVPTPKVEQFISSFRYEVDPTGRSANDAGAKLDSGKVMADLLQDFNKALIAVAEVATFGANKYSRGGWKSVPDGYNRYSAAMMRHWLKEKDEDTDQDSGLLHQAHLAWNALARLQFLLEGRKDA